jgi:hypothetical protein
MAGRRRQRWRLCREFTDRQLEPKYSGIVGYAPRLCQEAMFKLFNRSEVSGFALSFRFTPTNTGAEAADWNNSTWYGGRGIFAPAVVLLGIRFGCEHRYKSHAVKKSDTMAPDRKRVQIFVSSSQLQLRGHRPGYIKWSTSSNSEDPWAAVGV